MASARLFIIHGYMAAPDHHWFSWLKQQAEQAGISVAIPELPDSQFPDLSRWLDTLERTIGEPDENTWLVGHSLGCITLINYLTRRYPQAVAGGLILVSGFSEPVSGLEELDEFSQDSFSADSVISRIKHRAVIGSLNDEIVPAEYSLRLSQQLSAPFYGLPDSGHFLESDGIVALPLVTDLLQQFRAV